MKNKKAQVGNLFQAVLVLLLISIAVGLGTILLGEMAQQQVAIGTTAALAANTTLIKGSQAIETVSTTWLAIIVLVVVVGLLISILLGAFSFRQKQ